MALIGDKASWQATPFANPFTDFLTSLNTQAQVFSAEVAAGQNTRLFTLAGTGMVGVGDWFNRNRNMVILIAGIVITAKLLAARRS